MMPEIELDLLKMTSDLIVAFISRNSASPESVPGLLRSIHATLVELAEHDLSPVKLQKPAVPISESVNPDYVVCLECGQRLKSLKFHLRKHDLSPESYQAKWALNPDYPMSAPNFAKKRSAYARDSKFGYRITKRRGSGGAPVNSNGGAQSQPI